MLNNDQKKRIAEILENRRHRMICPMCQQNQFLMSDGYINNIIQNDLSSFSIGGPSIPSVALICKNCGFVSQHSIGILGLLPKGKNNKNE
jgi:hypothetical protein